MNIFIMMVYHFCKYHKIKRNTLGIYLNEGSVMEPLSLSLITYGLAFFIIAFFIHRLIRLNVSIYKKLGLHGFAILWERQLHWWIPTVRIICIGCAFVFILAGLGLLGCR